jgi:anti-sigma regulatory factor (Ser/Thr protein kinase)
MGMLEVSLPARLANLGEVRRRLRQWLDTAAVVGPPAEEVVLAVGEATTNAVEHAGHGVAHEVTMGLTAQRAGSIVELLVSDDGKWRPPRNESHGRGHGFKVMEAVMDEVAIAAGVNGTSVRMRKELQ